MHHTLYKFLVSVNTSYCHSIYWLSGLLLGGLINLTFCKILPSSKVVQYKSSNMEQCCLAFILCKCPSEKYESNYSPTS